MVEHWSEVGRRTGRTTRMLEEARRLASEGNLVTVIASNDSIADFFRRVLNNPSIHVVNSNKIHEDLMAYLKRERQSSIRRVVLVDHFVVAKRYKHIFEEYHAYDAE